MKTYFIWKMGWGGGGTKSLSQKNLVIFLNLYSPLAQDLTKAQNWEGEIIMSTLVVQEFDHSSPRH